RSLIGRGVEATVDGTTYTLGGPTLVRERDLEEPAELVEWARPWRDRGASVLYLSRADASRSATIIGGVALEDEVRPEARMAVTELQAMGRKVVLITGD